MRNIGMPDIIVIALMLTFVVYLYMTGCEKGENNLCKSWEETSAQ